MVKRFSWKSYVFLAFALILLPISWETNRTQAAVVDSEIPQEAIRLRILANSDSVQDQALKRRIRDAIIEEMNGWVTGPATIEEARETVRARLPEIRDLVGQQIARYGYDYGYQVELGVVPFPAKMYGTKVYPAGEYEALRVTIGEGAGQNWWCVLFPPLCFVDAATGEAVAKDGKEEQAPKGKKAAVSSKSAVKQADSAKVAKSEAEAPPAKAELQVKSKKQVRFFLWDKTCALFRKIRGWFA